MPPNQVMADISAGPALSLISFAQSDSAVDVEPDAAGFVREDDRESGILLHPTSFPGDYGIGALGPRARDVVDVFGENGVRVLSMLPLTPTDGVHSPYRGESAFAGNKLLISPAQMVRDGMIARHDLPSVIPNMGYADFAAAATAREQMFDALMRRTGGFEGDSDYERFVRGNEGWLDDYALFRAIKHSFNGGPWTEWPREFRDRDPKALDTFSAQVKPLIRREKAIQYVFDRQFRELKKYAAQRGVIFLGDVPLYLDLDSADAWASPQLFQLDEAKRPVRVAGVPDQVWGNPLYNWPTHEEDGFSWWRSRFEHGIGYFNGFLRVDHISGLARRWSVEPGKAAWEGRWEDGPADAFFHSVMTAFPKTFHPVGEDLGDVPPKILEIMHAHRIPGMKPFMFANPNYWDDGYLPHHYPKNSVAYTGNHDTETLAGYIKRGYQQGWGKAWEHNMRHYLGGTFLRWGDVGRQIVASVLGSASCLAVIPMQDVLQLGNEARMNRPGTTDWRNWAWRMTPQQFEQFAKSTWFFDAVRAAGRRYRRP